MVAETLTATRSRSAMGRMTIYIRVVPGAESGDLIDKVTQVVAIPRMAAVMTPLAGFLIHQRGGSAADSSVCSVAGSSSELTLLSADT